VVSGEQERLSRHPVTRSFLRTIDVVWTLVGAIGFTHLDRRAAFSIGRKSRFDARRSASNTQTVYFYRLEGALRKLCVAVVLVVFAALAAPAEDAQQEHYVSPWRTPWTYEEAEHWGDLDPGYAPCNIGKEQSPIDIRDAQKTDLPALRFESKNGPLRYVTNNRYTIRVNYHPGNGNLLIVGDKQYQLAQFHFHRPSEEFIAGKPYDMEVHLMYQASDGKVAGVTVFLKAGSANPTIQKLWEHMPKTEGQVNVVGVEISPAGLLPQNTAYYMYMGSLTAPPCTEGITWFVLKNPVEISPDEIDAFASLFPHDVRPLQPVNGRVVKESQ
jgi:carbonic anhydrase